MEVIVLAGGLGTRLKHVVRDVSKTMAIINNKPFLAYILSYLKTYECTKVIMAVGYKSESVKEYFGDSYKGMQIVYSEEPYPLGTGGAIKKALTMAKEEDILVVNGDTFFDCNLTKMKKVFKTSECDITVAIKRMRDYSRYGSVIVENNRIIQFIEKKSTKEGLINGGVYWIRKSLLDEEEASVFSFEKQILEPLNYSVSAFESDGYFIDIGIPEDYFKAQKDFLDEN